MKKIVLTLVLGALIGAAAVWYVRLDGDSPRVRRAEERVTNAAGRALESAQSTAVQISRAVGEKIDTLDLRPEDIARDLTATGKVVRRTARDLGEEVADATKDARITAAIKSRLAADPDLSALSISVDTTAGRVTLAGSVASTDLVGRAMVLALETDGVGEVISTLQVR